MQALGIDVLFKGINMQRLLGGLWISLRISLIAVAFSIVLGLIVGVLMAGDNPVIKSVTRVYLEIVRVMPQMVLLFIVFFGTTRVFGWNIEAEIASIIVFTFWGTAEMADLVRGALISIPKHQYESAAALGMEEGQIYRHIIIPQTLRRLIPLSINLVTRMIKTTSLRTRRLGCTRVSLCCILPHAGRSACSLSIWKGSGTDEAGACQNREYHQTV